MISSSLTNKLYPWNNDMLCTNFALVDTIEIASRLAPQTLFPLYKVQRKQIAADISPVCS